MKTWNKKKRDRLTQLLTEFVRFDTTQPRGMEAPLARHIAALFAPYGRKVETTLFNHGADRASLVVKILASEKKGGLAFVGHLDTVAVGDRTLWSFNPHAATEVCGVLYGRGATDMKGGLSAMTLAALEILDAGISLKKPLYLVYTADEERTSNGAGAVAESGLIDDVDAIVIPEMTNNRIAVAEKGVLWLKVTVHGRTAHGSMPESGINALDLGISFVTAFQEHLKIHRPDPLLGPMTATLTRFEGGLMTNVVPDRAVLELDCRTLPFIDHGGLLSWTRSLISRLENQYAGSRLELSVLAERKSFASSPDHPFIVSLQMLAATHGLSIDPIGVRYATDITRLMPRLKKPFVIFGPGEIEMAHQIDEHIVIDEVAKTARLFYDLIESELA